MLLSDRNSHPNYHCSLRATCTFKGRTPHTEVYLNICLPNQVLHHMTFHHFFSDLHVKVMYDYVQCEQIELFLIEIGKLFHTFSFCMFTHTFHSPLKL